VLDPRTLVVELLLLFSLSTGCYFVGAYREHKADKAESDAALALASQQAADKDKAAAVALERVISDNRVAQTKIDELNKMVKDNEEKLRNERHNYATLAGRLFVTRPAQVPGNKDSSITGGVQERNSTTPAATREDSSGSVSGLDLASFALWGAEIYNKWQGCVKSYESLEKAYGTK
jgi:hypothetical protein